MAENLLDGPPNPKRAKLSSPGFSANDSTGEARARRAVSVRGGEGAEGRIGGRFRPGPWAARPGRGGKVERGRGRVSARVAGRDDSGGDLGGLEGENACEREVMRAFETGPPTLDAAVADTAATGF